MTLTGYLTNLARTGVVPGADQGPPAHHVQRARALVLIAVGAALARSAVPPRRAYLARRAAEKQSMLDNGAPIL